MRIICTVTNDLSQDQRMHRICTSLTRAGHEVTLVGRALPDSLPLPVRDFRQVRIPCHYHRGKLFYLEYNWRLWRFLRRQSVDAINAVDLDTLLPGYWVARRRGIPCVYDAHEYFTETPEVERRPVVQKMWEFLARAILPRLTYAYTVGPALARLMSHRYGLSFRVIRNVPYRQSTPIEAPGKRKVLLYQGVLNEGRGLETCIAALPYLDECELWLAGKGDLRPMLERQAKRLGVYDRVTFLGFVPPSDLPALTRQAWLGLNLLENRGLSYYYSLANKAFDYIQAGLPSVQMDFPEYRDLQATYQTFLLLDVLSPSKLAALIHTAIAQPSYYASLRDNCRIAAHDLCWEKEEAHLLTFWQKVERREATSLV